MSQLTLVVSSAENPDGLYVRCGRRRCGPSKYGDGAALADPAAVVGELGPDLVGAGRSGCWVATLVRSRLKKL